ncbi:MAG TPA: ABC transporter permease [Anaerolineae bacterium]|nr:ABC transporter permease [Anaerolineae bacterium]
MSETAVVNKAPPAQGQMGGWIKRITSHFLVRKAARALFTIWFVTSLIFFLVRLMPSNPIEVYINELIVQYSLPYAEARDQAASLFAIDLDAPLHEQYFDYMGQLLRGDLGTSLRSPGTSVMSIIARFLPWTIFSVGIGLLLSFALGVLLGMLMAYKRDAFWEPLVSGAASVLSSIPNYIVGIVLLVYLGVYWGLVPIHKMRGSTTPGMQPGFTVEFIVDIFFHAALPILTYVLSSIGGWILSMKSSTMSTLGEDYVTIARARGLSEGRITTAYVGRNAMLPLITQLLISIGFVVGGSLLIESIFVYQGIGYRLLSALSTRDYPLMQGIFLMITISVVVSNLLADFVYGWLDPRVRIGGGEK